MIGVIGDVMLDRWIYGEVTRISPEAPVPVMAQKSMNESLGGAANVAANIKTLGQDVRLIGSIGDDANHEIIFKKMDDLGMLKDNDSYYALTRMTTQPTTTKTRFIAQGQQLMRWDTEKIVDTSKYTYEKFREHIHEMDIVILSDYHKGALSGKVKEKIISDCKMIRIPVFIDPKYDPIINGVTLVKPNTLEAEYYLGRKLKQSNDKDIEQALSELWFKYKCDVMITRGPYGLSILYDDTHIKHIPCEAQEVFDVSGAGDTTIAAYAVGLVEGKTKLEAAIMANKAAGIVVGKTGTAVVYRDELCV